MFYHCVCEHGLYAGAHSVPALSSPAPPQHHFCLPENTDSYEQPQQPSLGLTIQKSRTPEICSTGERKHQINYSAFRSGMLRLFDHTKSLRQVSTSDFLLVQYCFNHYVAVINKTCEACRTYNLTISFMRDCVTMACSS